MKHAAITGIGAYLPERRLTNADLEAMVDTTDEWIRTRTGIGERRLAAEGEATSDLAAAAGASAVADAGLTVDDIDFLVVGTSSPDHVFPSTASLVQAKLGLECAAVDVITVNWGGGSAAALERLRWLRAALGSHPLAVTGAGSGVTPSG